MVGRRIVVSLLVGYVFLLVLAGWRHEIRPAAFDPVTNLARRVLGLAGISPGVAVFTADSRNAPDEKVATICLEVRAVTGASARRVHPADGVSCPAPPPRLWVRGEQSFLLRSVVILRARAAARRAGDSDPGRAPLAELLARSIGAHFVARERLAGKSPDRYLLLWEEERVSYRTRQRSERRVALLGWRHVTAPRVFVRWRPDERTLRERGWVEGEP